MSLKKTVLIIPPNDAEAILITQLADKLGLPLIVSHQVHGASLDKGNDYLRRIREGGYTRVVVVEMPGVKTEKRIRQLGVKLVILDHHHYTGLSRAHDQKGHLLPSSLEQFIELFHITDEYLKQWGFNPRLVRGIGIQDRGYVWALQDEGYTKKQIQDVLHYHDELTRCLHHPKQEARKDLMTQRAWGRKRKWNGFWIVSTRAKFSLRPRLSRLLVDTIGKPTPLIIVEHGRGLIYVQESSFAMPLFEQFGGFTFGLDRNWGYKNEAGKARVTLRQVKSAIESVRHNT